MSVSSGGPAASEVRDCGVRPPISGQAVAAQSYSRSGSERGPTLCASNDAAIGHNGRLIVILVLRGSKQADAQVQ